MTSLTNAIERLRNWVESVAREEGPASFFSMETALLVLSVVYGAVMGIRARLYETGLLLSASLPCRVVSIGNIIAGGTGKTPMTILVAQIIRDLGYRVVVISRGYRGRMEAAGGVVSDGHTILQGPDDAGDEPYLMARILKGIPVVVGKRRYETGLLALKRFKPDVVVLDDAFQHLRLKRDLNLVLLDGRRPFGNGHLLPRGLLREPVSALHRAHAVIFTRSDQVHMRSIPDSLPRQLPVFYTKHVPVVRAINPGKDTFVTDATDMSILKDKKAVAFAGLADNAQFFNSLERAGCILAHTVSFADHHRYGFNDLDLIGKSAGKRDIDCLVTTFKDFVKIENGYKWPVALVAVDVDVQLTNAEDSFFEILEAALQV